MSQLCERGGENHPLLWQTARPLNWQIRHTFPASAAACLNRGDHLYPDCSVPLTRRSIGCGRSQVTRREEYRFQWPVVLFIYFIFFILRYWRCSCTCCRHAARARGQTLMMFTRIFSWELISKGLGPVKLLDKTSASQKLFEFFFFLF